MIYANLEKDDTQSLTVYTIQVYDTNILRSRPQMKFQNWCFTKNKFSIFFI